VALTKADKSKAAEREALLGAIAGELARHAAAHPEIAVTSALTGDGIALLRATLAALADPADID
jgi:GTP-binding protein